MPRANQPNSIPRRLLATVGAALALAGKAKAAPPADAELIELCRRYAQSRLEFNALWELHEDLKDQGNREWRRVERKASEALTVPMLLENGLCRCQLQHGKGFGSKLRFAPTN